MFHGELGALSQLYSNPELLNQNSATGVPRHSEIFSYSMYKNG